MATIDHRSAIPEGDVAALQEAIGRAVKGIRDPDAARKAAERMDKTREEIYRRCGLLDFAVPTIRALRDGNDG
jgi:hypothetical protein